MHGDDGGTADAYPPSRSSEVPETDALKVTEIEHQEARHDAHINPTQSQQNNPTHSRPIPDRPNSVPGRTPPPPSSQRVSRLNLPPPPTFAAPPPPTALLPPSPPIDAVKFAASLFSKSGTADNKTDDVILPSVKPPERASVISPLEVIELENVLLSLPDFEPESTLQPPSPSTIQEEMVVDHVGASSVHHPPSVDDSISSEVTSPSPRNADIDVVSQIHEQLPNSEATVTTSSAPTEDPFSSLESWLGDVESAASIGQDVDSLSSSSSPAIPQQQQQQQQQPEEIPHADRLSVIFDMSYLPPPRPVIPPMLTSRPSPSKTAPAPPSKPTPPTPPSVKPGSKSSLSLTTPPRSPEVEPHAAPSPGQDDDSIGSRASRRAVPFPSKPLPTAPASSSGSSLSISRSTSHASMSTKPLPSTPPARSPAANSTSPPSSSSSPSGAVERSPTTTTTTMERSNTVSISTPRPKPPSSLSIAKSSASSPSLKLGTSPPSSDISASPSSPSPSSPHPPHQKSSRSLLKINTSKSHNNHSNSSPKPPPMPNKRLSSYQAIKVEDYEELKAEAGFTPLRTQLIGAKTELLRLKLKKFLSKLYILKRQKQQQQQQQHNDASTNNAAAAVEDLPLPLYVTTSSTSSPSLNAPQPAPRNFNTAPRLAATPGAGGNNPRTFQSRNLPLSLPPAPPRPPRGSVLAAAAAYGAPKGPGHQQHDGENAFVEPEAFPLLDSDLESITYLLDELVYLPISREALPTVAKRHIGGVGVGGASMGPNDDLYLLQQELLKGDQTATSTSSSSSSTSKPGFLPRFGKKVMPGESSGASGGGHLAPSSSSSSSHHDAVVPGSQEHQRIQSMKFEMIDAMLRDIIGMDDEGMGQPKRTSRQALRTKALPSVPQSSSSSSSSSSSPASPSPSSSPSSSKLSSSPSSSHPSSSSASSRPLLSGPRPPPPRGNSAHGLHAPPAAKSPAASSPSPAVTDHHQGEGGPPSPAKTDELVKRLARASMSLARMSYQKRTWEDEEALLNATLQLLTESVDLDPDFFMMDERMA
eukprot:TRINITY_DN5726_c0_g1_i6.p1 TRINITY_DN5726_c0_g1~~TRINITY_DN5726_c0_g1_i6.p1  ORF type:complete len:1040 (-),score=282.39 TRINITY_DN5726_c0_g1_i6:36-3155(-)